MAWPAHRVEAEDVDTELFNPVDVGNWGGSEEVWGADRRGSQLEPVRRADESAGTVRRAVYEKNGPRAERAQSQPVAKCGGSQNGKNG